MRAAARLQRPKQELEAAVVLLVGGGGLLLSTGPRAANTWKAEQTQAALTYRWVIKASRDFSAKMSRAGPGPPHDRQAANTSPDRPVDRLRGRFAALSLSHFV